jgi:hypothetical protein
LRQVKHIIKETAAVATRKPGDAVAILSSHEKPSMQALVTTAPDLPPSLARTRPLPAIVNKTDRHGQFDRTALICSPARFTHQTGTAAELFPGDRYDTDVRARSLLWQISKSV